MRLKQICILMKNYFNFFTLSFSILKFPDLVSGFFPGTSLIRKQSFRYFPTPEFFYGIYPDTIFTSFFNLVFSNKKIALAVFQNGAYQVMRMFADV